MSRHRVEESTVRELTLDREDRVCPACRERMHVRCRRPRSILTLEGPLRLSVRLVQCGNQRCEHMTLYRDTNQIVLTIDGLQPEKGHETLYVVREVTQNRVLFAEPLLSGATDEIRKLFVRAKEIAERLGLKVAMSCLTIAAPCEAF